METFFGLGYTAVQVLAGYLYKIGGFHVPFLVLGAVIILPTVLSIFLIDYQLDEKKDEGKGMLTRLSIPFICVMIYAVVVCAISLSFIDSTLCAHLETVSDTATDKLCKTFLVQSFPTAVGLMFLLCGAIYTFSALVWGILIDRYSCSMAITMFGSIATVIAMFPSPIIHLNKNVFMIRISLAILSVAAASQCIPTFQLCLNAVKMHKVDALLAYFNHHLLLRLSVVQRL